MTVREEQHRDNVRQLARTLNVTISAFRRQHHSSFLHVRPEVSVFRYKTLLK